MSVGEGDDSAFRAPAVTVESDLMRSQVSRRVRNWRKLSSAKRTVLNSSKLISVPRRRGEWNPRAGTAPSSTAPHPDVDASVCTTCPLSFLQVSCRGFGGDVERW